MNVELSHAATAAERYAAGRALRKQVPRSSHAVFTTASDRPDPIDMLEAQAATRIAKLVPIRYGRMLATPFTFLRGSAVVMAGDLAGTPTTGLRVQACGDCHLSNFGMFATPERQLVFDVNDFDETLPAPFEWDVKRLAASFVVAGRTFGFTRNEAASVAQSCVEWYRTKMLAYAPMGYLEIWYSHVDIKGVNQALQAGAKQIDIGPETGAAKVGAEHARRIDKAIRKAHRRTSLGSLPRFAEQAGGGYRIKDDPPLIERIERPELAEQVRRALGQMKQSMPEERRQLLDHYEFVDLAYKVVGVGSVGTSALIALMIGKGEEDPLFLQLKQAQASVLEPYAGASVHPHHGQRVVVGQRLTQGATDIFLGWVDNPRDPEIKYYFRQLRDMKGSFEIETMSPTGLSLYAMLCGATLARAHARSGDAATIAGYLGRSATFDRAVIEFAEAYADQTERDHAALAEAVRTGRLEAQTGI